MCALRVSSSHFKLFLPVARMILVFLGVLIVSGCGVLPKSASITDQRQVYVWPVETCPSLAKKQSLMVVGLLPILTPLATPVINTAINGLVGVGVKALQDAADADKNGYTASGTNSRHYFPEVYYDDDNKIHFNRPHGYIVAFTKYIKKDEKSNMSSWCDDVEFNKNTPSACSEKGREILSNIYTSQYNKEYVLKTPDFFAEINLVESGESSQPVTGSFKSESIVIPRVVNIYYPKSLLHSSSNKHRTITITLAISSLLVKKEVDIMRQASIGIVLPGITPGLEQYNDVLANQKSSWIATPNEYVDYVDDTKNDQKKREALKSLGIKTSFPYYPINIDAKLTEVGDPSIFLQAFNTALNKNASDLSAAMASYVSPAAIAATTLQQQKYDSDFQAALATLSQDEAKYISTCSSTPSSPSAIAASKAAYQQVIADRQKVNTAALAAGRSKPFSSLEEGLVKCF
ncbi:MAG: hypothetical protein HY915_18850 [Desulfovibrio sp.]|nr:hypothetical protein [Desulfovibrio sp.]